MTERTTLKALALEIEEGLDQAIEAAQALKARVEAIVQNLGPEPIRAIRDRYEMAQSAVDAADRSLVALLKAKAETIHDQWAGIQIYEWPEIEQLEAEPEDAETRGDRLYHEAKDEGRVK